VVSRKLTSFRETNTTLEKKIIFLVLILKTEKVDLPYQISLPNENKISTYQKTEKLSKITLTI
jgi:hypothetical protein